MSTTPTIELWALEALAELLGVTEQWLAATASEGYLPLVRLPQEQPKIAEEVNRDSVAHAPVDELELLDVNGLAALLKVKKSWIYDSVEGGRLPAIKLTNRTLRFRRSDVREYLEVAEQATPRLAQADAPEIPPEMAQRLGLS